MNSNREFRPELMSRRSEIILWVLTVVTLASWVFLLSQSQKLPIAGTIFCVVMLLAAGSTSLSNWMDRNTVLTLKSDGVDFRNGLRNISLTWDQIQEIRVLGTRFGKQVHVFGASTSFTFRPLSVVENKKGEIRAQMGFTAGDFILEQILKSSGLEEITKTENEQGRYYARP